MAALSTSWKVFRAICVIQFVLVALQLMFAISILFTGKHLGYNVAAIVVYFLVFIFLYHGFSILNYNYPDIPLSHQQKRRFNILFLINFLLIAFLFAEVINGWSSVKFVLNVWAYLTLSDILKHSFFFLVTLVTFLLHLVFLYGMYKLRRMIYLHTTHTWVHQFDENNPSPGQ